MDRILNCQLQSEGAARVNARAAARCVIRSILGRFLVDNADEIDDDYDAAYDDNDDGPGPGILYPILVRDDNNHWRRLDCERYSLTWAFWIWRYLT